MPPGSYQLSLIVRDRNSPNGGRAEAPISIPALRPPAVSLPMAVYQARGRTSLGRAPDIVMNPRQSVDYGVDTLYFYVETYGLGHASTFNRVVSSFVSRVDSGAAALART